MTTITIKENIKLSSNGIYDNIESFFEDFLKNNYEEIENYILGKDMEEGEKTGNISLINFKRSLKSREQPKKKDIEDMTLLEYINSDEYKNEESVYFTPEEFLLDLQKYKN